MMELEINGHFPKNRGVYPPKWMVYFMKNPIEMDDLGGPPLFWKHLYRPLRLLTNLP